MQRGGIGKLFAVNSQKGGMEEFIMSMVSL